MGATGPVAIDGGLAANAWFAGAFATAPGSPVLVPDEHELTALGAGLMAAEAVGLDLLVHTSGRRIEPGAAPDWRPGVRCAPGAVRSYPTG